MLIMKIDFLCAEIIIFQNSSMSLCWHWVLMNFLGLFQLNCSIQSYVHPSFFLGEVRHFNVFCCATVV